MKYYAGVGVGFRDINQQGSEKNTRPQTVAIDQQTAERDARRRPDSGGESRRNGQEQFNSAEDKINAGQANDLTNRLNAPGR